MTEAAVRPASPDDTDSICRLLASVVPGHPKGDPAIYRWNYVGTPLGPAAAWVAEAEGRLVGHSALYTAPGLLDGEPVLLAHGGDAAIHPEWRARGLYTALARARAEGAAALGCAATTVIPSPDAVGANRRAGWQEVGRVRVWLRPLDPGWAARQVGRGRLTTSVLRLVYRRPSMVAAEEVGEVPRDLDALWATVRRGTGSGFSRDRAWWRWRYQDRPRGGYRFFALRAGGRLRAAAVAGTRTRDGEPFSYVFELLAEDPRASTAMLRTLTAATSDERAVGVLALPSAGIARRLRRAGFLPLPAAVEPRPMRFGVIPHTPRPLRRGWNVTWGDHDHV